MKISIFTPTHKPVYIGRLFESIVKQTHKNWEWIIVPNSGAIIPDDIVKHKQVKIFPCGGSTNIGFLKSFACGKATGDVFLEADHDDELFPTALEECATAFADKSIDFVYSNCCDVDGDYKAREFSSQFGWTTRDCEYKGHKLRETVSFPPDPSSISKVWFAPNHFRAWRAGFYHSIGGHNPSMDVLDDHELVCRTYINGNIKHIDKPLYVYHVHSDNTCFGEKQQKIQIGTLEIHDRYIVQIIERWCELNDFPMVDLFKQVPRWIYEDFDLTKKWPFEDNSIGVFRAINGLERLHDPVHIMKEAYRCLIPKGWLLVVVPSTDGRGAFQNPANKSFWNSNSFWYYTKRNFAVDSTIRFQMNRVNNYFPDKWHETFNVVYTKADLVKIGGNEIHPGGVEI